MTVERVLIIRHGQTIFNSEKRWQGQLDVPLDDIGIQQVQALAKHLRGRKFDAIYSSPLQRAWLTAEAVGEIVGVQPVAEERLSEINVGIFSGLTRDEIEQQWPTEWERYRSGDMDFVIPKGESLRNLQDRAFEAWETLVSQAIGREIALVSHGGTIRHLLLKILEHNPPDMSSVFLPNTCMTTLERAGSYWQLCELAAVPHLSL